MNPYRGGPAAELGCPRCKKRLPPLDVAVCAGGCGTWVSAFAATEVLREDELRPDPVTRWWKRYEPCPMCGERMALHGAGEGRFQGCAGHGYWVDGDAIAYTSLAKGVDHEALRKKRDDERRLEQDREERERAEQERAARRAEKEHREAALAQRLGQGLLDGERAAWELPSHDVSPWGAPRADPGARLDPRELHEASHRLRNALHHALGAGAADLLLQRLDWLEQERHQLAERVRRLEAALARRGEKAHE